ncbi:MDR family NADPH-dependent oxidoreductase [Phragmitibacter flavus]|nr:2-enoyl thioester reductase domain-containing protein [Phragmitibacter flavus]
MRLVIHQSGVPSEVVFLEEFEAGEPQGHEVRVRMLYAPINPADLNFIEGTYGKAPNFPAVPGVEGCGRVESVGEAVESLEVGDLVIPLSAWGSWTTTMVLAENQFAKLPKDFDEVQAAMLRVNPTTAWRLLHEYRLLEQGDWVVQNAGNSGVGRAVIQIAKSQGFRTISFVRRQELIAELKALGGDAVFLDDAEGVRLALELVGEEKVRLALNAVGGDSALRLMEVVSVSGAVVTYGAMSRRSLKVPNKYLIFKDLEIRGCWLSRWMDHASSAEIAEVMQPLVAMVMKGDLLQPVERVFEVGEYREALARAQESGRAGKVLLKF